VLAGAEDIGESDMESILDSLKKHWYPPSTSTKEAFSKHGIQLNLQHETLRKDKDLGFLDAQLFPEWPTLMQGASPPHAVNLWLPPTYAERRAGFYFCASLQQFMENVYLDLNLQDEHDHPDNRGWMNLFRHWSWAGMFRLTYAITFSTYGARFQQFCDSQLGLKEGEIQKVEPSNMIPVETKSTLHALLEKAEKNYELNFLEIELIQKLHDKGMNFDAILPLRLCVKTSKPTGNQEIDEVQYEFGFALAFDHKLVYFRIQDHLRNSGLARKALNMLYERYTWYGTKAGEKTPYEAFLMSMTSQELEAFKQRYGDNPDAFKRLLHSVEKGSRLKRSS
jgi:hypothetical protein